MKAIKINLTEKSDSKHIKSIIAGVLVCGVSVMLLSLLIALAMVITGKLLGSVAPYIMLLPLIAGGYLGGLVSAKINKANGLLFGVLISALAFIILIITGFATNSISISYMLIVKLLCLVLPGALGGIKGVNKKEKLNI